MKRKILVTLLAFCLIASLCVVGAAAGSMEDCPGGSDCTHEAAIGNVHYDTLKEAFEHVEDGETIKLLGDVTLTDYIDVRESETDQVEFTLDLGTHKLSSSGIVLRIFNSDVTITNGTVETTYSSTTAGSCTTALWCRKNTTLTIADDATISAAGTTIGEGNYGVGIWNDGNGTHVIIDGTINGGNGFTINGQLTDRNADVSLEVNGTIDVEQCGLYLAGYGKTVINDSASITGGKTGVEIRAGELDVNGGTITGGNNYSISSNSGGPSASGAGIAVSQHNTKLPISVKITDGEISGAYAVAEKAPETGAVTDIIDVSITGGEFKATVANNEAVSIIDNENILDITGGTFKKSDDTASNVSAYFPEDIAIDFDEETGEVVPSSDAVAEVDGVPYKTLQAAIDAAKANDTVTLVANVDEDIAAGTPLKVEKDITIEGKGKTISLTLTNSTASDGRDKILQVEGENAKLTLNNVTLDINGVVNTTNDRVCGDAIDLYLGGDLEANNSTIDIDGVAAAFVIQTAGETIELNNTTVTADNVRGNGSQGGEWTVNNSSISFTNCGSHGLSVETADVTNSTITVDGAGLCAVYGKELNFGANTTVNVTNSGPDTPTENWNKTETYYGAVQIKELPGCSLTVESSAIINVSGTNNTVYLPAGAELVNNGTINATVNVPADSDMNVVLFMADGRQYDVQVVNDGDSVRMPTLSKNGYTFTGWRVNSSNTIVKGGESYPITANTTFTAVWNMIMIPDTYDIAVDQPAHGTVDVSFSNASQGSVITVTATPDEGYELVYITVDGEPISGNSFVMPDHAVEVSALFAEIGKEVNFVDVSRADWFYDYVQYVAQNGLMEGTTRTAFEPNASMTRAMFWTVLARIDGETITGDAWKTLAQTWAVESGISDGTNADALITREQMVTMLYRYAGSPVAGGMAISEFTDGASVSDYATDAVTWALGEGILTGMGDGILAPQGTATRAQAAAMLMRFVEA